MPTAEFLGWKRRTVEWLSRANPEASNAIPTAFQRLPTPATHTPPYPHGLRAPAMAGLSPKEGALSVPTNDRRDADARVAITRETARNVFIASIKRPDRRFSGGSGTFAAIGQRSRSAPPCFLVDAGLAACQSAAPLARRALARAHIAADGITNPLQAGRIALILRQASIQPRRVRPMSGRSPAMPLPASWSPASASASPAWHISQPQRPPRSPLAFPGAHATRPGQTRAAVPQPSPPPWSSRASRSVPCRQPATRQTFAPPPGLDPDPGRPIDPRGRENWGPFLRTSGPLESPLRFPSGKSREVMADGDS
jgi:hypothetical protein